MLPPQRPRRRARQQLALRVEFEDAASFRSSYLPNFPDGGVRIGTSMEVGQRFLLDISFFRAGDPAQIETVVEWSLSAAQPDDPAAGLRFLSPSPEAAAWLADILDVSTSTFIITPEAARTGWCSSRSSRSCATSMARRSATGPSCATSSRWI